MKKVVQIVAWVIFHFAWWQKEQMTKERQRQQQQQQQMMINTEIEMVA